MIDILDIPKSLWISFWELCDGYDEDRIRFEWRMYVFGISDERPKYDSCE